ncbi:serine hydrolase [Pseudorhodoferax sp. Leaf267]|uniref:serine hydrolase domain-containing protein n=1 Tax=Pseudorhodoferax sp. Leaf267 TaxID=1736316 RepID=UPI00138EE4B8|nr:serine hydrolase domain-containing protein [Pseudorhodoferax sp. Leaf267]
MNHLKRSLSRFCTVALVGALVAGCASAPSPPTVLPSGDTAAVSSYLSKLIAFEMQHNKIPGLSISVVDDQQVVWTQGFGESDVQQHIAATPSTLYRAGSISKLFTATAVLQLAEQRRIDLDRPLQNDLPEFQPAGPASEAMGSTDSDAHAAHITPRQVMTHHAGLPRDRLKGMYAEHVEPLGTVVALLNDEGLAFRPGEVFSYSNLGFSLLAHLVQTQAGMPFAQYLRRSVLGPLGMQTSLFEAGPSTSPPMAKAYEGRQPAEELALRDLPAGGLNTSVADMARFISMVFAQGRSSGLQVLRPESVASMLQVQNGAVPLDLGLQVGLAWMLSTLDAHRIQGAGPVAHHAGATLYHRSQMYMVPDHKLGVIVMANSSTATRAVDRIALAALSLQLQAKTGIRPAPWTRPPWDDTASTPQYTQSLLGDYSTAAGLVRITQDAANGKLQAEVAGQTLALRRRSDDRFGLRYALLGLVPLDLGVLGDIGFTLRAVEGRALLVGSAAGQDMLVGERLGAPAPLSDAWRARLGDYVQTNADALSRDYRIRLFETRGRLLLEISNGKSGGENGTFIVNPVSDIQAEVLQNLAQGGQSLRVVRVDGVEQIRYSGYLARKR